MNLGHTFLSQAIYMEEERMIANEKKISNRKMDSAG